MTTAATNPDASATARSSSACAECRRLKHKCDRKIPCGRCVRKCCASICPNGTLSKEEGHGRFWPRVYEYQNSLVDLANRIAQLEDALRVSHGRHTNEPHPLLDEDQLRIKEPFLRQVRQSPDPPTSSGAGSSNNIGSNELAVSLDTLSITESGRSKYIGPTAWSSFLKFKSLPTAGHQTVLAALPPEISFIAACFTHSLLPGPDKGLRDRLATLRCFLPGSEEVFRLKVIFYRACTFAHDPVPEETFDVIFSAVYETPWNASDGDEARVLHVHAVMFMFLALATAHDPALPAFNDLAAAYYELACASLVGTKLCASPTFESVQAMCLMAVYLNSMEEETSRMLWSLLGIIIKSCQLMGLHRDPRSFKFTEAEAQQRRKLFWAVYQLDVVAAYARSLPPSFTSDAFDTLLPAISPSTEAYDQLVVWRYRFSQDCLQPMQREIFSNASQLPPHNRVLAMDEKIRTYRLPDFLQSNAPISDRHRAHLDMILFQRAFLAVSVHGALLRLHRTHLLWAMREHPENASKSPFAESIMACYRSASAMLAIWSTSYEAINSAGSRMPNFFKVIIFATDVLVMIKRHCPDLADGVNTHLQSVPHAITCWKLHRDMGEFESEMTQVLGGNTISGNHRLSPEVP